MLLHFSRPGLANVDSGCNSRQNKAIIVQARDYRCAFVFAHELGHALGLDHDERYGCGSSYIMSAHTGHGKTKFSKCSAQQLKNKMDLLLMHYGVDDDTTRMVDCYRYHQYPNPVSRGGLVPPGPFGS